MCLDHAVFRGGSVVSMLLSHLMTGQLCESSLCTSAGRSGPFRFPTYHIVLGMSLGIQEDLEKLGTMSLG